MLNVQRAPTRGRAPARSVEALLRARSYACTEDSDWTKPPHRGANTNGVALRGGDGNTPHDHPRRESPGYPDSRLRVDRPSDFAVIHDDPVDGSRWAETPADCRSEGPSRVDARD